MTAEQTIERLKQRVDRHEEVLKSLVPWLVTELGRESVNKLLDKLEVSHDR